MSIIVACVDSSLFPQLLSYLVNSNGIWLINRYFLFTAPGAFMPGAVTQERGAGEEGSGTGRGRKEGCVRLGGSSLSITNPAQAQPFLPQASTDVS